MSDHILISIIIPIYNAEKTIKDAVRSIIDEFGSAINYEIILVNDGSTDNSLGICKKLGEDYPNLHLVNKNNGGVSSARNVGIQNAVGDYIMFIDSDDYLANGIGSDIVSVLGKFDLIVFGRKITYCREIEKNKHNELVVHTMDKDDLLKCLFPCGDGFVSNKVYSAKLLKENNITFDETLKICEDTIFNLSYYKYITSACYIDTKGYIYYQNPVGAYNCIDSTSWFSIIKSYKKMSEIITVEYPQILDIFQFYYCYMCYEAIARYKKAKKNDKSLVVEFYAIGKNLFYKSITASGIKTIAKIKLIVMRFFPRTAYNLKLRNRQDEIYN